MNWIQYFLAPLAILSITYWYLKRIHSHWKKQNIPFVSNPIPFFGHMLPSILFKEHIIDFADRAYQNFNTSMVGFFFMQQPGIIVRDLELVKSVLQTNFSSFNSNLLSLSEQYDPILAKNTFFTNDPNLWKIRRNGTSNNLTGKKLKYLSMIIQEVSKKMCTFVERKIRENDGNYECELKSIFVKYTGEVVANAAFAMEGQCFEDNPDKLSFAKVSETLFEPSLVNGIKQALIFYLPSVANFFRMGFMEKRTESYLRENIKAILKQRQQEGTSSPNDYLQFCTESNANLDGILADIANFYIDVYETTSTVIANVFYCLSENPKIQTKLRDHVKFVIEANGGSMSYDALKQMTYLDQVIQECLRYLPPLAVIMKRCNESITLKGTDGLTCQLQPGNAVFVPARSIHLDEEYWPNPKIFDPDRFSAKNQDKYNRYTFLAFGEGPRMCVGMRLGISLVKQVVTLLLVNFSIEHSEKTKVPLVIEPSSILMSFKGGLWARFRKLE